jgi:hypothetical protein
MLYTLHKSVDSLENSRYTISIQHIRLNWLGYTVSAVAAILILEQNCINSIL